MTLSHCQCMHQLHSASSAAAVRRNSAVRSSGHTGRRQALQHWRHHVPCQQRWRGRSHSLALRTDATGATDTQLATEQVVVQMEEGSNNSRRVYAGVDVGAPWANVWSALTDYEGLGNFIPGLTKNECLERTPLGARLLQVGEQSVAMGLKFRARVVLDIEEHPHGLAPGLISDQDVDNGSFPGPRSSAAAGDAHDITFELHEGDFQTFRGVWRMQQQAAEQGGPQPLTRLSYALFVRPQKWLPVRLIQSRIESEVLANLAAVRAYAERMA